MRKEESSLCYRIRIEGVHRKDIIEAVDFLKTFVLPKHANVKIGNLRFFRDKKVLITVPRSPHVNRKAQDQFNFQTYRGVFEIKELRQDPLFAVLVERTLATASKVLPISYLIQVQSVVKANPKANA
jgi:ribosomal protein S10